MVREREGGRGNVQEAEGKDAYDGVFLALGEVERREDRHLASQSGRVVF